MRSIAMGSSMWRHCGRRGLASPSSTPSWRPSAGTPGRGRGEIDLLSFQVQELVTAAIDDPDEDRALEVVEDELADAVGHREAGARAHAALADDGQGRDLLVTAMNALGARPPYADVARARHR